MNDLKTTEFDTQSDVQESVVDFPTDTEIRNDEDVDDGHENFVDFQNSDEDVASDVDENAEGSNSERYHQNDNKQSREENSAIRAARIRAEREAETRASQRADSDIAQSGLINPITNQPFRNMKEVKNYGEVLKKKQIEERARREGKKVEDVEEEILNREFITRMRKKEEARDSSQDDFKIKDVQDFVLKHPEFNSPEKLETLENNKAFRSFCGSRFGREPLTELYDSYVSFIGQAENTAIAKSASRASRSTGSGNDGGDMLTPSEKRALDEWNENYPEMKMTPKEFKARH